MSKGLITKPSGEVLEFSEPAMRRLFSLAREGIMKKKALNLGMTSVEEELDRFLHSERAKI